MAANVQKSSRKGSRSNLAARSVKSDFQIRFTAGALFLFTVAAIILSWINFQKSREFQVPYDGARWIERNGGLFADRVEPDGPAAKQGITRGDQLVAVTGHEVKSTAGLMRSCTAPALGPRQPTRWCVARCNLIPRSSLLPPINPSTAGCASSR